MEEMIKERLHKKDILTIPNILSFVRILLIPVIVILYCVHYKYIASVSVIFLSGITDIIDGKIARKYNMISDFGKFIDPVADKLTQAAMIFCLVARHKGMLILIFLMVIKESLLLILGLLALKRTDTINSAKWYGKVSTATIYGVMIILFLLPNLPDIYVSVGMLLCGIVLIGSTLLYVRFYYNILKTNRKA